MPAKRANLMEQLLAELLKALVQYVLGPLAVSWLEERLKSKQKSKSKNRRKH